MRPSPTPMRSFRRIDRRREVVGRPGPRPGTRGGPDDGALGDRRRPADGGDAGVDRRRLPIRADVRGLAGRHRRRSRLPLVLSESRPSLAIDPRASRAAPRSSSRPTTRRSSPASSIGSSGSSSTPTRRRWRPTPPTLSRESGGKRLAERTPRPWRRSATPPGRSASAGSSRPSSRYPAWRAGDCSGSFPGGTRGGVPSFKTASGAEGATAYRHESHAMTTSKAAKGTYKGAGHVGLSAPACIAFPTLESSFRGSFQPSEGYREIMPKRRQFQADRGRKHACGVGQHEPAEGFLGGDPEGAGSEIGQFDDGIVEQRPEREMPVAVEGECGRGSPRRPPGGRRRSRRRAGRRARRRSPREMFREANLGQSISRANSAITAWALAHPGRQGVRDAGWASASRRRPRRWRGGPRPCGGNRRRRSPRAG